MRILRISKVSTFLVSIMMMGILLCCSSQVLAAVPVTDITVTSAGNATTVVNAGTLQMSVAVLPVDSDDQTVSWSVAPGTGTATINPTGLLTGTGLGTVTVTATANDGSAITGTKLITIMENTLQSIAITTPAIKLSYSVGDTLDITGLVVTGIYSDNSTKTESITPQDVIGFDSTTPVASQTLAITIGGKTITYNIEIKAAPVVVLNSIAITTSATKLIYTVGDTLDLIDLVVTGTYNDGSTKVETVTAADITGFNSEVAATDQVLTITVGDKTTTYEVQINEMTEIETDSPIVGPSKVWTIKLNGLVNESSLNGKIYVTNSKGKKQRITCTATVVNGFSQIEVKPDKNYTPDDYMLWVKNIKSIKGIGIKKQVFMKFTVQPVNPQVTVSSVEPVSVTTTVGIAPVLPASVTATMSDGTTKTVNVSWDAIVDTKYALAGTFTVNGTVPESTIAATCTVIVSLDEKSDPNYISINSVTPSIALQDNTDTDFEIVVSYGLTTTDQGEINVGFNNGDNEDVFIIAKSVIVDKGSGEMSILAHAKVKNWEELGSFKAYVNLSEYPHPDHWSPLDNDTLVLRVE